MKWPGRLSPMQLAVLAVLGSLFVPACLLLEVAIPRPDHQSLAVFLWHKPSLMLLFYGPLLGGFALVIVSQSWLRRGIEKNAWAEDELAPLRKRLEQPIWFRLYMAAAAIFIGAVAWRGYPGSLLLVLFPFQMTTDLRWLFRPRTTASTGLLSGPISAPIRSEHWGHTGTRISAR